MEMMTYLGREKERKLLGDFFYRTRERGGSRVLTVNLRKWGNNIYIEFKNRIFMKDCYFILFIRLLIGFWIV